MFTTEELQAIDRKYFTVIVADAYDVTLISNNTKHEEANDTTVS